MAVESSLSRVKLTSTPEADIDQDDGLDNAPDEAGEDEDAQEREPRKIATRKGAKTMVTWLVDQIDDINLARYMEDSELDQIGIDVVREFHLDDDSRKDWFDKTRKAMRFATQEGKPKQFPWPNASNVIFPLIGQTALDFHARTYPAIIQGRNVVKGVVWGEDDGTPVTDTGKPDGQPKMQPGPNGQPQPVWLVQPGEKRKRADRIAEHMSWQLLDEMTEWEPQTDQMLLQIPISGGAVRKTWYDPIEKRNRSEFVSLANLVWNYHAPSFEAAPRHTEKQLLYPYQIIENERAGDEGEGGMFLPQFYGPGGGGEGETFGFNDDPVSADQGDDDSPHLFIEQHRRLDLDDDGYAEPYVVTVHLRSGKVVRIVARYDADSIDATKKGDVINRIDPVEHYTLYPFLPNIEGGSYPMGFGHLLRPLNEAINTTLNQMFDAGTLQNAGGGFISDQLGVPSGQILFSVGKYTRVNAKGSSIRDAVFPIPFPGPSTVLFQLLGILLSAGKELASIGNILAGDAAVANAPPTTILALIEQGMKLYTAIHKRIFRAEKAELAKLYRLNRLHLKQTAKYKVGDEWREVTEADYRLGGGVEPIADPTMLTDMQKLGRASILMQYNGDPLLNQIEIRRRMFDAAGIDRIEELFAKPDPQAAQAAQVAQQMAMAMGQAELGKTRSEELKNQTQAFLNMALARKNATAQEETFIEAQLDFLRLHIEALNTQVKAAAVDHSFHATNMSALTAHAQRAANAAEQGQSQAHEARMAGVQPAPVEPTPGPTGAFPQAPVTTDGPAVVKPAPGGPPAPDASPLSGLPSEGGQ